ncbi:cyclin-G2 [Pseudomonas sp. StFLB209]|nr:cyclin-G2 [Pseudomonas sp. StFLB209]
MAKMLSTMLAKIPALPPINHCASAATIATTKKPSHRPLSIGYIPLQTTGMITGEVCRREIDGTIAIPVGAAGRRSALAAKTAKTGNTGKTGKTAKASRLKPVLLSRRLADRHRLVAAPVWQRLPVGLAFGIVVHAFPTGDD